MSTLKTATVVVLLLAVLYGVYSVLNQPEALPPKDIAWMDKKGVESLDVDFGNEDEPPAEKPARRGLTRRSSKRDGQESSTSKRKAEESKIDASLSQPLERESSTTALPAFVPPPDLTRSEKTKRAEPPTETKVPADEADRAELPFNRRRDDDEHAAPRDEGGSAYLNRSASHQEPSTAVPPSSSPLTERETSLPKYQAPAHTEPATDDASGGPVIQKNPYMPERDSPRIDPREYGRKRAFEEAWNRAEVQLSEGRWREALAILSAMYREGGLTSEERNKVLDVLDPLAAKVIYSAEHLLETPYAVRRGDTLASIAAHYDVAPQLLQSINGVKNPEYPVPATNLKVLRGPFYAEIDLATSEMTVYLQKYYAGRFPVSLGNDPPAIAGNYEVRGKEPGHRYYTTDGKTIAADDPRNPYGRCWIDLGRDTVIHGSSDVNSSGPAGCISLSPRDAQDVMGILSKGSKVTIR